MKQGNQNKPRCAFTPKLKLDIVKEANANKASISAIARKYDENANQLLRWMREVKHNKMTWARIATGQQKPMKLPLQTPTFLPVTVSQQIPVQQFQSTTSLIVTLEFANGAPSPI